MASLILFLRFVERGWSVAHVLSVQPLTGAPCASSTPCGRKTLCSVFPLPSALLNHRWALTPRWRSPRSGRTTTTGEFTRRLGGLDWGKTTGGRSLDLRRGAGGGEACTGGEKPSHVCDGWENGRGRRSAALRRIAHPVLPYKEGRFSLRWSTIVDVF